MTRAVFLLCILLGAWFSEPVKGTDMTQLLFLYDRMGEPIFMPKGPTNNVVYNIPQDWLNDRYRSLGSELLTTFTNLASGLIPVRKINLPDFSIPKSLGKNQQFSHFLPEHRRIATRLIEIFMSMRTLEDFTAAAVYARSNLNPSLFAHALSVALVHREDTKGVIVPSEADVFPQKFFEGSVFSKAREESAAVLNPAKRVPITPHPTANALDPEHALAHFREDIGVNLHHWHWHLVYPNLGDVNIVKKDRRGELFYYMHEQILARYNFERFCAGLPRVKRLAIRKPLAEGYYPHMDRSVASRSIPGRPSNMMLSDISRGTEKIAFKLADLETWEAKLLEVARTKSYVTESGEKKSLTMERGIDTLGNMVEASILSPNQKEYGNLHNMGHVALALCHDPDGRHLQSMSVMGDVATAMRDMAFYRWHKLADDIFQEYKRGLPPYTTEDLEFQGVKVTGVEVQTVGSGNHDTFETFWQQHDIDISRGLDFAPRSSVHVRTTHLNHKPFTFNIKIQHSGSGQREGYVRVFIAPKFDENGTPMKFDEQRTFMVELDKFHVTLKQHDNNLHQQSTKSSVTIPFERSFRNLEKGRANGGEKLAQFNFCGCGWPHHMLIPKGTAAGIAAQLFVHVTDYSKDKVDQPTDGQCNDASSYCGVHGQKYPDRRPMGFPFDRPANNGVEKIQDFLTPNMFVKDVMIKFTDRVEAPPSRNATIPDILSNPIGTLKGRGKGILSRSVGLLG